MLQEFQSHIDKTFPELRSNRFLIAVSGGIDSVVLAHLCHKTDLSFALAHVNHRLRGAESDTDAHFVASLAQRLGVPYYTTSVDTQQLVTDKKGNLQDIARELRYSWFSELIATKDFKYVVTAHHANDDLETLLINLSRGTGLKGLSGIPESRGMLKRPLLPFSREAIKAFAERENLEWREDASNETDTYLRNALRHNVIPEWVRLQPQLLASYQHMKAYLISVSNILDKHIQNIKKQVFKSKKNHIEILFDSLEAYGQWEDLAFLLLADYGFTDWKSIRGLKSAPSGTIIRSGSHELLKDRGKLILRSREDGKAREATSKEKAFELRIEGVPSMGDTNAYTLYIDKDSLKHRLKVRKWKKGDYFYPLGMGGKKKKLSKYLKDIKMDVFSKEEQLLLCDGEDIAWVIGQRADERFKVKPDTRSILRIICA